VAGAAAAPRDHEIGLGPPVDRQRGWATAGLLGIALVWGASYTAVKDAVEKMPSADFLAIRFTIAALTMVALRPGSLRRIRRATMRHGIGLGVGLSAAYLAVTVGLERTTPAVAGVLTGLLVVIAALVAAATVRTPISGGTWASLGIGALGLAAIALRKPGLGIGEGLILLGALVLAGHLVALAVCSERHDLWALTVVQLLTAATLLAMVAAPGGITTPPDLAVWGAVLLTAVLATAVAYVVQTWAQRRLSPARVGVLLATEPVFAVLVAVWLADEIVTWQLVAGGALVVAAIVVTELAAGRPREVGDLVDA